MDHENEKSITDLKFKHLESAIDRIADSVSKLSDGQESLVKTITKLTIQMKEFLDLKNTVINHDRTIVEHNIRIKAIEALTAKIESITNVSNKNSWAIDLAKWVGAVVVGALITLAITYFKTAVK